MEVINNGNSFVGDSRALHVLPRGYYRAHLYTGPANELMLSLKENGREIGKSWKRPHAVRKSYGDREKDEYSDKMRIVKILEDKYDSSGYTK